MTCRAEAPEVERFARQTEDRLQVIGLGSNGDLGAGRDFVARYGPADVSMLYDESGDSWSELGIPGQPAALLLGADGTELQRWFGPLDFEAIEAAIA